MNRTGLLRSLIVALVPAALAVTACEPRPEGLATREAAPDTSLIAEARAVMDACARELLAGDRAAIAARYDRTGALLVRDGERSFVPIRVEDEKRIVRRRPTEMPVASIAGAFFALSVSDIDASARWYTEKLGLRPTMEVPPREGTRVTVLEGGGLIVELVQRAGARPLSRAAPAVTDPQLVHGIFKAGVIVEDFDATLAQLRARGVEIAYGPFPARNGQRANFIVRDNAGNLIQFFGR